MRLRLTFPERTMESNCWCGDNHEPHCPTCDKCGGFPPKDAIEIGPRARIKYSEYKGEVAGIQEYHEKADGAWCCGWIQFAGASWAREFKEPITAWSVVQREPLTLTPSILCKACGNHGHITNGRWVPA